ncbi:MAG TPA: acetyl-CoA hydrolase/transferase C-terminal domain-containing protein [Acidimicrobiales bacterium]|nr:acetyl-CoA hydrolase/transferase C-terminal domain-containing protein [Acidimicrobiales bacterium]
MADGPDGPLPEPEIVAAAAGVDIAEVLLGWVVREPAWIRTTSFSVSTFLTGPGTRSAVASGAVTAVPARLSAIPGLLAGRLTPDVLVVGAHETESGFVLAHSPGFVEPAMRHAGSVVVERWPGKPRRGAPLIAGNVVAVIDRVDPRDAPPDTEPGPEHRRIGELVADLIPAAATIQWGPGVVGASVVASLRRPVRVRSGLVTDELVALDEAGLLEAPADAAYIWGGRALTMMACDGRLRLCGIETTHDLTAISSIERFVAVNTALQVGLDGAANVETVAGRVVSGAGGHPDFAAGASRSPGGLSIVAIPATSGGHSSIVATPEKVSTPRSDVDVVVTEFGSADLRGLDDRARAERIISIAAPEHRDHLTDHT